MRSAMARWAAGIGLLAAGLLTGFWLRGTAAEKAPDPLAEFDLTFRKQYAKTRAATLASLGPVVLYGNTPDEMTLIHNGTRKTVTAIPTRYHDIKSVSHLTLTVYVLFESAGEGELSAERLADAKRVREQATAMRGALAERFKGDELARQETLVRDALTFLDAAIATKRATPADLRAYCRHQAPAILANFRAAALAQIETTHAAMLAWKKDLTDAEWGRLRVVVFGVQMPRKENIATQYFAALLGERGEGQRVVYAEGPLSEERGLALLATHTLDAGVAVAFFRDPERMERDILGDPAREILQTFPLGR